MEIDILRNINFVFIAVSVFLCVTLAPFLLFNKSEKSRANIFLGSLVVVIFLYVVPVFIYQVGLLEYFPHVIQIYTPFTFLFGPIIYLYVCAATQKDFQMRPILWWHFLPFGLDFFRGLPFYLQSGAEKLAFFQTLEETGITQVPIWVNIVKVLIGLAYFFVAIRLTLRYRKHLGNEASFIDTAYHRWLIIFCLTFLYPTIAIIGFSLFKIAYFSFIPIYFTLLFGGFFLFLATLYLNVLYKPELFHTFPHQMLLPKSSEEQKQKYENSKLQAAQKDNYLAKIIAYVEREKPYKFPELTLAELAEKVKIPAHYVSQIINEKLGVNFLDFINGYRMKAAQKMLVDPKLSHYTIISVAYEAGFNAKSTFYAVFKKQTGMTPSAYRKQTKAIA